MSNWWKRFFGLDEAADKSLSPLPLRDKLEHDHTQKKRLPDHHRKGRFEDPHRNFEVKMVRQSSDHGSADFDHIPTFVRKGKQENMDVAAFRQREHRQPSQTNEERLSSSREKDIEHSRTIPIKRRFAVSSVPSPIYGFNKRPAVHLNGVEPPVVESVQTDKREGGSVGSPDDFAKKRVMEYSSNIQLHPEPLNSNEDTHTKVNPEGWISELAERDDHQTNELETVNGLESQEPPHREKQRELYQPPRRSHVPFNVMMYQSDRRSTMNRPPNPKTEHAFSLDLLNDTKGVVSEDDHHWIEQMKILLSESLKNFNVKADVVGHTKGPTVTRFEIRLHPGVKVNKVIGLTEDLKLTLSAKQIRIAPITGKNTVGIELPNAHRLPVSLKALLQSAPYETSKSPLTAVLGQDLTGHQIVTDLAKMPHGLIAGATGSGKSVCIHSLILSLIYKATPDDLRFILIDPKVVELAAYRELPHLATPVITQPKDASLALKWAVEEMENRYQLFAETGVRDLSRYNELIQSGKINAEKLPYLVIVIDELADLMMTSPQEVEAAICRIAQKARAAGIHMLLATQRPSVDVITGLIKSNIPTRIAFSVSSQVDSRTILDMSGAERLLGQGDLLFSENGSRSLLRLQGTFVTDEEIERVTATFGNQTRPEYLFHADDLQERSNWDQEEDALFQEAAQFVIDQGQASASSLQRRFRIGYNRAARLVDQLETASIISESNGSKPRQVLMDKYDFERTLS